MTFLTALKRGLPPRCSQSHQDAISLLILESVLFVAQVATWHVEFIELLICVFLPLVITQELGVEVLSLQASYGTRPPVFWDNHYITRIPWPFSGGRKRSWIIYCWLVWCERKTLFLAGNLRSFTSKRTGWILVLFTCMGGIYKTIRAMYIFV